MTGGTPESEVDIHETLVYALLHDQHPDLAEEPLTFLDRGWDNTLYRLGDSHILRLPRRQVAANLIVNEQRWLPVLAPRLPIAIPAPVRVGRPGLGYPWAWSIVPWFDGRSADLTPPDAAGATASWAAFLSALHQDAPAEAPVNEVRGIPLVNRADGYLERVDRLHPKTDLLTDAVLRLWDDALAAPRATRPQWIHGDLHARNILVRDGKINAVIDWGDITAGDVATDLASFWMLFEDRQARDQGLRAYGASDAEIARAKGWALLFGVLLLDTGLVDFPAHVPMGERTLRNLA